MKVLKPTLSAAEDWECCVREASALHSESSVALWSVEITSLWILHFSAQFPFVTKFFNPGHGHQLYRTWGFRRRLESEPTDDGYSGFPKNTDTIQWWYNDLMIQYNTSSQLLQKPVTTGGASVHWSRFGLQFLDLLYGFSPDIYITSVNISYRYCLNILSTWVEQSNRGLSWFMNNTIISYESHLITTQFRSGFHIYILDRSFCLMSYNIAMIQHYYSRCVIRQLLWLRSTYPNAWFRLGFYMCSLQELSANWLLPQAPDRSVPGARKTYYTRIPWQRTTSHLTRALRYRGDINA